MRSYQQWKQINEDLGYSLIPPNIPRTQTGFVGNELRTDSGMESRSRNGESENRFNLFLNKFKNKITELPTPRSTQNKGLWYLGMEVVGKSTFDKMKDNWHERSQQKNSTKQMGHDSSTSA